MLGFIFGTNRKQYSTQDKAYEGVKMSDRGKMVLGVIVIILVLVGCVNLCSDGDSSSSSSYSSSSSSNTSHTCDYCGKSGAKGYDAYVSGNYWKSFYLCDYHVSVLQKDNVTLKRSN